MYIKKKESVGVKMLRWLVESEWMLVGGRGQRRDTRWWRGEESVAAFPVPLELRKTSILQ